MKKTIAKENENNIEIKNIYGAGNTSNLIVDILVKDFI